MVVDIFNNYNSPLVCQPCLSPLSSGESQVGWKVREVHYLIFDQLVLQRLGLQRAAVRRCEFFYGLCSGRGHRLSLGVLGTLCLHKSIAATFLSVSIYTRISNKK